MTDAHTPQNPAGWYHAQGDPPETKRYWDGSQWVGEPQVTGVAAPLGGPTGGGFDNLASAGKRIGARLVDNLLMLIVFGGVAAALVLPSMDFDAITTAMENGTDIPESALPGFESTLAVGIAFVLMPFLWELLWHGMASATPGKLLFGMRIVRIDAPGEALGWAAGAKRALLRAAGILTIVPLVGLLMYLVWLGVTVVSLVFLSSDKNRQTVMDKVAKTIVVNK